jgi:threonine/homoserine/homoserine lactone efflux protein
VAGHNAVWFMDGINLIGAAYLPWLYPEWVIGGTGDFNGDGKTDILFRDQVTGHNAVWFMNGINLIGAAYLPWLYPEW